MTNDPHDILFPQLPHDMRARTKSAVRDAQLQQFVNSASRAKVLHREAALAEAFPDGGDAIRTHAAELRQHALDHLDFYLEQFTDKAEQAGGTVHFAADSSEANAIVTRIARENRAKLCVKAKSMATEEIRLLSALEAIGCQTVETDLGEYILQLDRDAPSHLVTPMIHKDRCAVGRAFERELGVPYCEDPEQLAQIARGRLRETFRRADLGVTGGNFLVADTGSVVLCTNEGNGRMCTNLPRVHVAVVGIEKMLATLDHLSVMLKLLARAATGQPLTCYTQLVTGPRRPGEQDGPEQVHIVLLDNGRSRVLAEETRELLRCIRCGACLNACPVYRKAGGHAYGSVYSGPIGAVLTPALVGVRQYPDLPEASSLCGACYEACPVKINIPEQLVRWRRVMMETGVADWRQKLALRLWAWTLKRPWAYRWALRVQGTVLRGVDGYVQNAPGPLRAWTDVRDLPAPAKRSFHDWWDDEGR